MYPRFRTPDPIHAALLLSFAFLTSTAIASPIPLTPPSTARDAGSHFAPFAPATCVATPHAGSSADGAWQEFGQLQTSWALTVYDPAHDRLIALGGSREVSNALPLSGALEWQPLPPPASPLRLEPFSSAYDSATGLVYFVRRSLASVEVRTLDPQTGVVVTIPASGTPPDVFYGSPAIDAANQRIVVLGSPDPNGNGRVEVWAFDLSPAPRWSQWMTSGPPPRTADFRQVVVDAARRRLLVLNVLADSIWALPLDGPPVWLRFPTNGLTGGINPNPMVHDDASDRVWTIDLQGEPYSMSLETFQWSALPVSGPGPSPRFVASVAIDPVRHRLLVCGGQSMSGSGDTFSDIWALDLDGAPAWTVLIEDATRPPVRGGASDGYDRSRRRLIVFGGWNGLRALNDTWVLDLAPTPQWAPLATQGTPPPGRFFHVSAWDGVRDQLVVFGGRSGNLSPVLGDLWTLSFGGGTPTWSPISPAGPAPLARTLAQMVYDSARDRFLLLFGSDGTHALGDVWELRLSPSPAWRELAPAGSPPPARGGAMCAYDPAFDRVLLFGGGDNLNDLWALDLGSDDGTWQQLHVASGPSGRNLGLLRLDTGRSRLLLFGGYGVSRVDGNVTYIASLNDAWALELDATPAWRPLAPSGHSPLGRDRANGTYDPLNDRLVLTCGGAMGSNDTWAIAFTDIPTSTQLALVSSEATADRVRLVWAGAAPGASVTVYRREPNSAWRALGEWDADGRGFIIFEDREVTPGTWLEYRLGVKTGAGETFLGAARVQVAPRALTLTAMVVGGHATFAVELPSGEPATLVLFDVGGRRVWTRAMGHLGRGAHEVRADDAVLAPALYFARLTQAGATRLARVVLVR